MSKVTHHPLKLAPVLYTFPGSVWAAAPHLALFVFIPGELGIDADFSEVNLFEASFQNPNGTLPTLTHEGKSYKSTAEVIDYLVAPETFITKVVHEDRIDPNFSMVAARNDEELAQVSGSLGNVFHTTRLGHLKKYAATPEAQVHKSFYDNQITKISGLHAVLNGQAPDDGKQRFFSKSSALWDGIKVFTVETLPTSITEGPFIGGVRPGVDDFHVGAWIARIAFVSGAQKSEEGLSVLEKRFGTLPEKVKAYWRAWIVRDSWVKAYPNNALH
ncbi:hypothetical protein F5888DRAFT_1794261 [Russula emetica]|nr:hypothetical protein F5888DRAFT_1794261 [Russula emetica]